MQCFLSLRLWIFKAAFASLISKQAIFCIFIYWNKSIDYHCLHSFAQGLIMQSKKYLYKKQSVSSFGSSHITDPLYWSVVNYMLHTGLEENVFRGPIFLFNCSSCFNSGSDLAQWASDNCYPIVAFIFSG